MTTVPTLTFFNNTGGVGTTALVYHLAWMLSDLGYRVLAWATSLTLALLR